MCPLIVQMSLLGFIANFISGPVISAFTSAVALTIIATQFKPLLGLSFPAEEFVESIIGIFERLDDIKREVRACVS